MSVFGTGAVVVKAIRPAVVAARSNHIQFVMRQARVAQSAVRLVNVVAAIFGRNQFAVRAPRHAHGVAQTTRIDGGFRLIQRRGDFPNRGRCARAARFCARKLRWRAVGIFTIIGFSAHAQVDVAIVIQQQLFERMMTVVGQAINDDLRGDFARVIEGLRIHANDAAGFADVHPAVFAELYAMWSIEFVENRAALVAAIVPRQSR